MKRAYYLLISLLLPIIFGSTALAATPELSPISSHHPGFMMGHHGPGKVAGSAAATSTNWSGYAANDANGTYNSIASSWVQPPLNCSGVSRATYSSYWVGLDGFSNSTVEQIGTEADCSRTTPVYGAWYEMYPSNPYEVRISLAIHPGDQLSASVNYHPAVTTTTTVRGRTRTTTTPANYVLALANTTTGKSYSVTLSPRQTYARSSAEIITEAPYSGGILPLANYGTVNYTSSLANGLPLGGLSSLQAITMQNPAGMLSTPSNFDASNQNFSTTWSSN